MHKIENGYGTLNIPEMCFDSPARICGSLMLYLECFLIVRVKHAPGFCSMYDICGSRSDGKVLNCPLNTPAVKVLGHILQLNLLVILFVFSGSQLS